MKTPKEFNSTLKEGIVTAEIMGNCLYSLNKRAKNMRDKERTYRNLSRRNWHYYDVYDNEERYRAKKEEYYRLKSSLLEFVTPSCIHVVGRIGTRRIEEWEDDFAENAGKKNKNVEEFVDQNGKYHKCIFKYGEFDEYFLYYIIGDRTFHSPITKTETKKYEGLQEIRLDYLDTYGADIEMLISVQFCKKVLDGLKSGKYHYSANIC